MLFGVPLQALPCFKGMANVRNLYDFALGIAAGTRQRCVQPIARYSEAFAKE